MATLPPSHAPSPYSKDGGGILRSGGSVQVRPVSGNDKQRGPP